MFEQLHPGTAAYNNAGAVLLHGDLDEEALAVAFESVMRRHAPLRSRFEENDDGEVLAVVATSVPTSAPFRTIDVSRSANPGAAADDAAHGDWMRPFDLATGPVWRLLSIRIGPRDWMLVVTIHHICSDGASLGILFAEVETAYRAALRGARQQPVPPAVGYYDVVGQREHGPGRSDADRAVQWWCAALAGVPDGVDLDPLAVADRTPTDSTGAAVAVAVSGEAPNDFHAVCRRHGASLFAGSAALLAIVLHVESGQLDIPLIVPVDTRDATSASLIGCFVNNVVLRLRVDPASTIGASIADAGRAMTDAVAHSSAPFGRVVAEVGAGRSSSRMPFSNVALVHNNAPTGTADWAGLQLTRHEIPVAAVRYDLALAIGRGADGGLHANLEYSSRFSVDVVRELAQRWKTLVTVAVREPDTRIAELAARLCGDGRGERR